MSAGTYVERRPDGTTRELFSCYDTDWRLAAKELLVLNRLRRETPARTFIGPEIPTAEPVPNRKWAHDWDGTMPDPAGRGTSQLCSCDSCIRS